MEQEHVLYFGKGKAHTFRVAPYGVSGTELYHLEATCECGLETRSVQGIEGVIRNLRKLHRRHVW